MIIFPLSLILALSACKSLTMAKFDADIQEATSISCLLADGTNIAYTVGSATIAAADISANGLVQASSRVANGSSAMCAALTKINSQIATTATVPTASATLVTTPSTLVATTP
jgi:hypothetical protein